MTCRRATHPAITVSLSIRRHRQLNVLIVPSVHEFASNEPATGASGTSFDQMQLAKLMLSVRERHRILVAGSDRLGDADGVVPDLVS